MSTLVLTRKVGQKIMIGDSVVVTVTGISHGQVKIAIDAPKSISVDREEIYKSKKNNPRY